jgi:hypothetical protein
LDSLHVIAYRMDPLFLIHHIQTLTYMARARAAPRATRARRCTVGGTHTFGVSAAAAAPAPAPPDAPHGARTTARARTARRRYGAACWVAAR